MWQTHEVPGTLFHWLIIEEKEEEAEEDEK